MEHECASCGCVHNKILCPNCGSVVISEDNKTLDYTRVAIKAQCHSSIHIMKILI